MVPLNVMTEPPGGGESGQKLVPVRVSVKLPLPAVREDGVKVLIAGCPNAGLQTATNPAS